MRLSSLVPTISSNLVAALETRGIRTEADLLYKASAFEIYKLLPAGTVTLQELIDCIEIVAGVSAASGFSGTQLYHAEEATRSKDADFRSGHVDLDSFLKGLNGQVIEISGDRSSGKSTLALNLVLRSIAFSDTSAVWIDTTGEFSAVKASTILAQAKIPDSVLERIQISFAFDIGMAQEVLQELHQLNDPQIYRLGLYNSFAGTPPELRFCTWACYHDRIHATIEDVLVELRGDYHGHQQYC